MSETCAEVAAQSLPATICRLGERITVAKLMTNAIHPDLPAMPVEDVRRAIALLRWVDSDDTDNSPYDWVWANSDATVVDFIQHLRSIGRDQ